MDVTLGLTRPWPLASWCSRRAKHVSEAKVERQVGADLFDVRLTASRSRGQMRNDRTYDRAPGTGCHPSSRYGSADPTFSIQLHRRQGASLYSG